MTRISKAALAWITEDGKVLAQWNRKWQVFSLIGGHVESGESFREACVREICEEIECEESAVTLTDTACTELQFEALSRSAGIQTDYHWRVFEANVSKGILRKLPSSCRWLTLDEIEAGATTNGESVAKQVQQVLKAIDPMGQSTVVWLSAAYRELDETIKDRVSKELWTAFGGPDVSQIIVKQRFHGFSDDPHSRMILAAEIQSTNRIQSSVLKIGEAAEVRQDFDGWWQCVGNRGIASRLFVAPVLHPLGNDRAVVEYPDVYQYYNNDGEDDEPKQLESLVRSCILRNRPPVESVVRTAHEKRLLL